MSAPETEAGRRMFRRLSLGTGIARPYATQSDRGSWEGDIAAIEAEAIATERARIVRALDRDMAMHVGCHRRVLAIIEPPE